jgi:hypothetical protein
MSEPQPDGDQEFLDAQAAKATQHIVDWMPRRWMGFASALVRLLDENNASEYHACIRLAGPERVYAGHGWAS